MAEVGSGIAMLLEKEGGGGSGRWRLRRLGWGSSKEPSVQLPDLLLRVIELRGLLLEGLDPTPFCH